MIHQHYVSHSLWGSILNHWASHWCPWGSCIVSCIPFIVNWTWYLQLRVKNTGAWDASEAPVAAIGLSLWTTQGVLRWVYRACRSQILPHWNNRGRLLRCQRWTLQSRTGVFHSVSSHPTPSWLPSMYSDTTNYPSVFTFWKLYLSAPAQHGMTIYLSITAWVNGISSLILCIDPNFSFFKMGVILGIAYFSHITLIIFIHLSYPFLKMLDNMFFPQIITHNPP